MSQRKTKLTSTMVALLMATSPSMVLSEEVKYLVGRSLGIQENYVQVKVKNNEILEIQNISKKKANSSPYKIVDSNGKLGFFYPSDYDYQINKPEKKNIAKYRKLRRKFWKSYAGVAANSLLFNEDKNLEKLDRLKRQREIAKEKSAGKKSLRCILMEITSASLKKHLSSSLSFTPAAAHFLSGLSHKKMQDYKSAVKDLEKAKKYKFKNNQLYYELAQSHFALNQLEKAYEEFKISVEKNFQPFQSKYYMGWIHEKILEIINKQ